MKAILPVVLALPLILTACQPSLTTVTSRIACCADSRSLFEVPRHHYINRFPELDGSVVEWFVFEQTVGATLTVVDHGYQLPRTSEHDVFITERRSGTDESIIEIGLTVYVSEYSLTRKRSDTAAALLGRHGFGDTVRTKAIDYISSVKFGDYVTNSLRIVDIDGDDVAEYSFFCAVDTGASRSLRGFWIESMESITILDVNFPQRDSDRMNLAFKGDEDDNVRDHLKRELDRLLDELREALSLRSIDS